MNTQVDEDTPEKVAQLAELLIERLGIETVQAERLAWLVDQLTGPAPDALPSVSITIGEPVTAEIAVAEPALTIGRIVHYHTQVKTYAAIVTAVYRTGVVDLVVFDSPMGVSRGRQAVREGGAGCNNTWSWPDRSR